MSIDQNASPPAPAGAAGSRVSAIENEIPTYRAISAGAVFSLVLGVLSLLSFAHWSFLLCAVAAIVVGVVSERKIVRLNDVLTGRSLAQAGIGLGLVFGLASLTNTLVQNWVQTREAERFARRYAEVVNKGTVEELAWYGQSPRIREGKTPQELFAEIKKQSPSPSAMETMLGSVTRLKSTVQNNKAEVHFVRLEQIAKDGLDVIAPALLEIHPGAGKSLPEGEEYALAVLRAWTRNRKFEWFVENVSYPYKPASYIPAAKPVDDGHGHAH